MAKVQIEIEIPDGHEVVDVIPDVSIYEDQPCQNRYTIESRPAKPFLINGVPSDWPDWLTCDWITKDADGDLYFHYREPKIERDGWYSSSGNYYLDKSLIAIDIPGNWMQSKRENPRRKK